jgi:hypothetical protein
MFQSQARRCARIVRDATRLLSTALISEGITDRPKKRTFSPGLRSGRSASRTNFVAGGPFQRPAIGVFGVFGSASMYFVGWNQ